MTTPDEARRIADDLVCDYDGKLPPREADIDAALRSLADQLDKIGETLLRALRERDEAREQLEAEQREHQRSLRALGDLQDAFGHGSQADLCNEVRKVGALNEILKRERDEARAEAERLRALGAAAVSWFVEVYRMRGGSMSEEHHLAERAREHFGALMAQEKEAKP